MPATERAKGTSEAAGVGAGVGAVTVGVVGTLGVVTVGVVGAAGPLGVGVRLKP